MLDKGFEDFLYEQMEKMSAWIDGQANGWIHKETDEWLDGQH